MGKVRSAQAAGNIIRRIREESGISRAALSKETGIAPRTIYALEQGESPNFGLGKYLRLLDALGLSMDIDLDDRETTESGNPPQVEVPEYKLADIWKLD